MWMGGSQGHPLPATEGEEAIAVVVGRGREQGQGFPTPLPPSRAGRTNQRQLNWGARRSQTLPWGPMGDNQTQGVSRSRGCQETGRELGCR